LEKERSINKLYREKVYIKISKSRPLPSTELKLAEENQQKILKEKTSSVKYEKIINGVLHYYETLKISAAQAIKLFISGFKNYEKILVNALYSVFLKERKTVDWFFETSIKVLQLYIIRQNLETDLVAFIQKVEVNYEVMNMFERLVPGIKDYFIKEVVIDSLESR